MKGSLGVGCTLLLEVQGLLKSGWADFVEGHQGKMSAHPEALSTRRMSSFFCFCDSIQSNITSSGRRYGFECDLPAGQHLWSRRQLRPV